MASGPDNQKVGRSFYQVPKKKLNSATGKDNITFEQKMNKKKSLQIFVKQKKRNQRTKLFIELKVVIEWKTPTS